jgi:hypothetical protein
MCPAELLIRKGDAAKWFEGVVNLILARPKFNLKVFPESGEIGDPTLMFQILTTLFRVVNTNSTSTA